MPKVTIRIAGLQIVIVQLPPSAQKLSRELLWHTDECRDIQWPTDAEKF